MARSKTAGRGAPAAAAAPSPQPGTPAKRPGMFTNAANWLLSRLPWFKDRYELWSTTKRVVIAFLLYIVILPVIPIVVGLIMYLRDPQGFTKSKAFPIISAIIVAQLGLFGVIAVQPPQVTDTATDSTGSSQVQDGGSKASTKPKESVAPSKPSGGRIFDNCDEAFKAGVHDLARSDASYRPELDRDNDGVACER